MFDLGFLFWGTADHAVCGFFFSQEYPPVPEVRLLSRAAHFTVDRSVELDRDQPHIRKADCAYATRFHLRQTAHGNNTSLSRTNAVDG